MTRIIVAGGRDFNDVGLLSKSLDKLLTGLNDDIQIISGAARGADSLGEEYAVKNGYQVAVFPADWNRHGKRAGYLRNMQMAQYAIRDACKGMLVAFWDGESRGTKHMIELATGYGLEVYVVRY